MEEMKYYGAVDLENPVDGYCWNRAACPEKIVVIQEQCGKNIELLRFDGFFSGEGETVIRKKWRKFLEFLMNRLIEDIYGYSGEDKDSVIARLGIVCVIPYRASAACRNMIREILKDMGVGQVRFVTKEIAAVLYLHKVRGTAGHTDTACLLLDAGEQRGTVSIVQVQHQKVDILRHISSAECGAMAFDSAMLDWLRKIFDNGFQNFKTDRIAFRKLLENWMDGRIFMKSGSFINLNIGDLDSGNLKEQSSEEEGENVKIVSNGYTNRLSLSAEQIGMFGAKAFEKVRLLLEEGLSMAEKSIGEVPVIINGCYLSFPPLSDYLRNKKREQAGECLIQSRTACMQGALTIMQGTDSWVFSGILKRTWGIVMLDQDRKQHFEILLPGGEELPFGCEKRIFVMPGGMEERIMIHFCSAPVGWQCGDDESLLSCEKSMQIISDNKKFPHRKIQVSIRVSDRLLLSVYDMTSGRRVCDEVDSVWERVPDFIIEAEEEMR